MSRKPSPWEQQYPSGMRSIPAAPVVAPLPPSRDDEGSPSNWDGGQANSNYGGTIAINAGGV